VEKKERIICWRYRKGRVCQGLYAGSARKVNAEGDVAREGEGNKLVVFLA